MHVLVTGATGLAGRAIVDELSTAHRLRLLRHRAAPAGPHEVVSADLGDDSALRRAVEGVDAIVHAAGVMEGPPAILERVNHAGTRALATAAAEVGVARFVFLSTGMVYRPGPMLAAREDHPTEPTEAYGGSKLAAERAVRDVLRERAVCLRLPSLYRRGPCPFLWQAAAIVRDLELPWIPPHDPPIEMLHVADLARAIRDLLERDAHGATYNLGHDDRPTYRQLIDCTANALGLTPRWVQIPPDTPQPALRERFAPPLLQAATVPRTLSSETARHAFGYAPRRDWRVEIPKALHAILRDVAP